ncbi:uncharacterized protein LOC142325022 [Lycorma delicatula]|uniref:uncharacterized protein LOC142325022 n=1 Tax=Lycorma delicatula TaxID=130591 RepID=UPI003F5109A4
MSGTGTSPALPPVVGCRMLRSPSHESVTTDLSLFSVSSLATSEAAGRGPRLVSFRSCDIARGPSPNPDKTHTPSRAPPPDIPEILWFEEENELIRSCAVLSSALGLQKSFSTSDITAAAAATTSTNGYLPAALGGRSAISELALSAVQRTGFHPRLEHASRSCSTWVAVGDVASTSQLPSPHGGQSQSTTCTTSTTQQTTPPPPSFTAADLIRSVNKKVRQNYIRRRLMTTYKALERLSQSEFNLDRLEMAAAAASSPSPTNQESTTPSNVVHLQVPGTPQPTPPPAAAAATLLRVVASSNLPLTVTDVERERGKPLSKYDRNMMIFNWLHTLDDSSFEGLQ